MFSGMERRRFLPVLLFASAFAFSSGFLAAVPVAGVVPKEARRKIAEAAEAYRGVPYRFGGTDRTGLDCSGLVFVSLLDSMGIGAPRTVRTLKSWTESLTRSSLQSGDLVFFDTTGSLSHVGIYLGDGRFIHAASEGAKTGVIVSSLDESYWSRAYAGAGRIVPAAEYLGVLLSVSGALTGLDGPGDALTRGAAFTFGAEYDLWDFSPGLELRPEWDATLGVLRVPLTLSVGLGEKFRIFVGPALVLGNPSMDWKGGTRKYAATGGLIASGGLYWSPFTFPVGDARVSLYGEFSWQRYEPNADEAADVGADNAANLRAAAGVRVRWGI